MKYFFSFLTGVAVGAGGMMLWLRKDIQKQLSEIKTDSVVPDESEIEPEKPDSENNRKEYHRVVMEVLDEDPTPYREMAMAAMKEKEEQDLEEEEEPVEDKRTINIHGIDADTYIHDHEYAKDHIVYYRGDKVMATETGAIIQKPAYLVGTVWEDEIGRYAKRTAFIRNHSLGTDYEIYVEEGTYLDEYGPLEEDRED